MFRNFVKPAAFEKVSGRETNGEGDETLPDVSPNFGHMDGGDRQPQSFTTEDRKYSHSTANDVKILQAKCQSPGSLNVKGGMHKTSIYVNGTGPTSKNSANLRLSQSDSHQQQCENKQQDRNQHHRCVSVHNSTSQTSFQKSSDGQKRLSGDTFHEQIRLSNSLTDVQIRHSRTPLDEQKRLSSGAFDEPQRLSNSLNDAQKRLSSGPNYEQKRLSSASSDEPKRLYNRPNDEYKQPYNGYNDEPKRQSSGPVDVQKRPSSDKFDEATWLSSGYVDKQKRPSGSPTDVQKRMYNSPNEEHKKWSSGPLADQNRLHKGPNDDRLRLTNGPNNEQKRQYNGPDDGQMRLYSNPNDVQNRKSSSTIAHELSHKNSQQSGSSGKIVQMQSTKLTSTAPASVISVKSGHSAQSGATENSPTTNESANRVPELHQRGLYYQSQYNVVPPPPPLFESAFAGLRDIRNPSSIHEKQIVSVKGTVRGFKNRVRAGIATFWAQSEDKIFDQPSADQPKPARNYRQLEHGRIVVYGTSMSVVRETSERCRSVRRLLQNHMVRYEERDLYMSREYQQELQQRLASDGISTIHLPHVFADGIHMGGAEELEKLNEAGELRGLLDHYQKVVVRFMCEKCGGYRFVPCEFCHGSKRSLLRNHFTAEFCALRCMHCDENGLRRCDLCADQQE